MGWLYLGWDEQMYVGLRMWFWTSSISALFHFLLLSLLPLTFAAFLEYIFVFLRVKIDLLNALLSTCDTILQRRSV